MQATKPRIAQRLLFSRRIPLLLLLFGSVFLVRGQTARITGVVLDRAGNPIPGVSIRTADRGTTTDEAGFYLLTLIADVENTIIFSHVQYRNLAVEKLILQTNETYVLNPVLTPGVIEIDAVEVTATGQKALSSSTSISMRDLANIPGANPGVESLLKLLPGVSSDNELSTQFRVRGGNFDENLVYVNGIEVYRPFLVRSAQQEGLSFLNSQLISKVAFSPGGFQARYGDKLSSVLDVEYVKPSGFAAQVEASLLGVNASVENSSRDRRLTQIGGIRYRDNSLFVNSLPEESTIQPIFFDAQTYTEFRLNRDWTLGFLGTWSTNRYVNEPVSRVTTFGTIQEPRTLFVDFDGREESRFKTSLGALQLQFNPDPEVLVRSGLSVYHTYEEEYSDVLATYAIGSLSDGTDGEGFVPSEPLGAGQSYTRRRNQLDALIFNVFHNGLASLGAGSLRWGMKFQHEDFRDIWDESEFLFERGVAVRPDPNTFPPEPFEGDITAIYAVNARNRVTSGRLEAYTEYGHQWEWKAGVAYLNLGIRGQGWRTTEQQGSSQNQWLWSPRAQLAFKPSGASDMVWKLAIGNYQQPPFYRELRDPQGQIQVDVQAQNSWHATLGNDWSFTLGGRPFKLGSELYYKTLTRVNAYTVNDVRIRYRADNLATAYAAGLDLRLSGAFVPGAESWVSLGLLRTRERIGDRAFIPRPTDQFFKFALLFQDYVPQFPRLKLYLNLVYQTGVPGGTPPDADPYDFQGRLRDYRRADLGISYIFDLSEKTGGLRAEGLPPDLQFGIELFNMFNNLNSITNTWVRDAESGEQVAIPNFLTTRVLNVKMKLRL